jgi:hypothetical protein
MSGLPEHIVELVDQSYDGNYDFNRRAFTAALWFVGQWRSEDDYVDFVSTSGLAVGYTRNDLERRLRKTYQDAENKYDPAFAGGSAPAGFAEEMAELYKAVDESKLPKRAVALALIQHAVNLQAYK